MKNNPHYAPKKFLDMLQRILRVKNDRQLAARFNVLPSQVCKIRHHRSPVSADFLINIHEETGLSLSVLRSLMGDFRENTRRSTAHPVVPPAERLQELQRLEDAHRSSHLALPPCRSYAHPGYAGTAN